VDGRREVGGRDGRKRVGWMEGEREGRMLGGWIEGGVG
jgi:hypothetical protein